MDTNACLGFEGLPAEECVWLDSPRMSSVDPERLVVNPLEDMYSKQRKKGVLFGPIRQHQAIHNFSLPIGKLPLHTTKLKLSTRFGVFEWLKGKNAIAW